MDVSDPQSPNFGKHWSMEEISRMFSPSVETVDAVRDWLSQSGISPKRHSIAASKGHIQFMANMGEVEDLLATEYHTYEHEETGAISISCDQYHLPSHIKHHIDFVTPSVGFESAMHPKLGKRSGSIAALPVNRKPGSPKLAAITNAGNLDNCAETITPACVKGEHYRAKK